MRKSLYVCEFWGQSAKRIRGAQRLVVAGKVVGKVTGKVADK